MAYLNITVVEKNGTLVAEATEETVVSQSVVASKEQLQAYIATLTAEIAKYQILIDAIDLAPNPIEPTP